jgi:L-iditol 2-dehydrogenase
MTLPSTAQAAVVVAYNEELQIREYPLPQPAPGGLVAKVDCSTVCGTDVHAWEGVFAKLRPIELPITLGHEIAGTVAALGDGVTVDSAGEPLQVGDRIVWVPDSCGHCYACTVEKMENLCPNRRYGYFVNADNAPHFHAGFSEYTVVPPRSARFKIPDGVKSEWASASSCALRTVVNAFSRLGNVDFTHHVVIQGAGPLGLFATAIAATHNPKKIIVIGGPETRLAIARAWGADLTISISDHPNPADRLEAVKAATGGRGGDVVGEFSGGATAFAEGLGLAAPNGRYVVAGTVGGPDQTLTAHQITYKNLAIFGVASADASHYYKALQFVDANSDRFDWDLMLGSTYGLGDVTTALRRMQRFEEIKSVIVP